MRKLELQPPSQPLHKYFGNMEIIKQQSRFNILFLSTKQIKRGEGLGLFTMGLRREETAAGARMDEDGCLRAEGMGMDQGLRSLGR